MPGTMAYQFGAVVTDGRGREESVLVVDLERECLRRYSHRGNLRGSYEFKQVVEVAGDDTDKKELILRTGDDEAVVVETQTQADCRALIDTLASVRVGRPPVVVRGEPGMDTRVMAVGKGQVMAEGAKEWVECNVVTLAGKLLVLRPADLKRGGAKGKKGDVGVAMHAVSLAGQEVRVRPGQSLDALTVSVNAPDENDEPGEEPGGESARRGSKDRTGRTVLHLKLEGRDPGAWEEALLEAGSSLPELELGVAGGASPFSSKGMEGWLHEYSFEGGLGAWRLAYYSLSARDLQLKRYDVASVASGDRVVERSLSLAGAELEGRAGAGQGSPGKAGQSPRGRLSLSLRLPGQARALRLSADTPQEALDWDDAIRKAVERSSPGYIPPEERDFFDSKRDLASVFEASQAGTGGLPDDFPEETLKRHFAKYAAEVARELKERPALQAVLEEENSLVLFGVAGVMLYWVAESVYAVAHRHLREPVGIAAEHVGRVGREQGALLRAKGREQGALLRVRGREGWAIARERTMSGWSKARAGTSSMWSELLERLQALRRRGKQQHAAGESHAAAAAAAASPSPAAPRRPPAGDARAGSPAEDGPELTPAPRIAALREEVREHGVAAGDPAAAEREVASKYVMRGASLRKYTKGYKGAPHAKDVRVSYKADTKAVEVAWGDGESRRGKVERVSSGVAPFQWSDVKKAHGYTDDRDCFRHFVLTLRSRPEPLVLCAGTVEEAKMWVAGVEALLQGGR